LTAVIIKPEAFCVTGWLLLQYSGTVASTNEKSEELRRKWCAALWWNPGYSSTILDREVPEIPAEVESRNILKLFIRAAFTCVDTDRSSEI
jgi:hypothetical protein